MPPPPACAFAITFVVLGTLELSRTGVGELRALLVQPKRLAFFAYLILANPSRLHRRDPLLPLFWPEATEGQARRSLRQALHFLRQAVGSDVLSSSAEALGLRPDSVPGWFARALVWPLTHAAAAYAAAGDTVNLARLADSVVALGAHSAYGRDRVCPIIFADCSCSRVVSPRRRRSSGRFTLPRWATRGQPRAGARAHGVRRAA